MKTAIILLVCGTLTIAFIGAVFYIVQAFAEDQVLRAYAETGVDHAEQPATGGRCRDCRRQVTGLAWVIVAEHLGGGLDRVCHGCAAEGTRKGWFRASLAGDATVYDIAVAEGVGDLDDVDTLVQKWAIES